ncbi:hypothetical protein KQI42_04340 [Tissierella sp. MSJ-40]|uniref:Uncharacterized protein n=1 Tax=Tissierella simiarum TaxID=2841534 RepID=A0ABS6E2T9_9FIRM|nr:hypothetical protein [Tissierella simiarum]MBU5437225.1 hypothetical protein [Tissierella simiarum]
MPHWTINHNHKVKVNKIDTSQCNKQEFPIAYIPDSPILFEELTVLEHFDFVKTLFSKNKYMVEFLITVTHLLNMVERFCDNYIIREKGSILSYGKKEDLIQDKDLNREIFMEDIYLFFNGFNILYSLFLASICNRYNNFFSLTALN